MRHWLTLVLVRAAFAVLTACLSALLLATAAAGAAPLSYGNLSYSYDLEVDDAQQPTGVQEALSGQGLSRASGITGEPSGIGHLYDVSSFIVAPNSSTVYRVQGGVPPAASQTRIGIGTAGEMTVSGDGMLFVTIDDFGRAQAFAANNRPGASIIAFDVDPAFVTQVRNAAVPQSQARNFPGAPQIADPLQTSGSFGLPAEWIQRLQDAAIPGTGRAVG